MSKRVRFLKEEEGGRKAMCEVTEKIAQAAEQKAGDYCMFGHNGCCHLRRSGRNYMGSTQQKTGCG